MLLENQFIRIQQQSNRNMLFVAAYMKKTCYISSKSCFQMNYRYASASVEDN